MSAEGTPTGVLVRAAMTEDARLVHRLVRELADYERLLDQCVAGADDIRRLLFAPTPRAYCDIAEVDGQPAGFALWCYNVSTFEGRAGIYLEDLYVRPFARRRGAGRALLASLARRCLDEGLARLDWAVLDWNATAIAFYDGLGADERPDWRLRRLSGEALRRLGASG